MGFFNQYSFLIFSTIGGFALVIMLWRWTRPPLALRLTVLVFYTIGVVFFALNVRYTPSSVENAEQVETVLVNGQPTLLMFYSNYCVSCLASLPAVREMQTALVEQGVNVLLLNIHERPGSDLLERYRFEISPTYLVFNAAGQEVLRSNSLPTLPEIAAAVG